MNEFVIYILVLSLGVLGLIMVWFDIQEIERQLRYEKRQLRELAALVERLERSLK